MTIVIQTNAGSVGSITDSATITSQETDPNPAAESASVTTTVLTAADLSVSLAESPAPALEGSDLTYTITVNNLGPNPAGNVVVTLPVASGAAFVSATAGRDLLQRTGRSPTWAIWTRMPRSRSPWSSRRSPTAS